MYNKYLNAQSQYALTYWLIFTNGMKYSYLYIVFGNIKQL